jgi:exonuclease VII small subunit
MTVQPDDPIAEYQARAILELEDNVRKLENHRLELDATIVELRSLIRVYQRSRAVRLTTALQGIPLKLRRWARHRSRKWT